MKKFLTLTFVVGMIFNVFSQEAADKTVLAGITLGGSLNFNNPQTNTIDSKTGGDFLVGMVLDWNFSKNIGLSTGLEFDFNRFKTIYKDAVFFDSNDKEILRSKDEVEATSHFLLAERKHKSIYLSLPIMLKFQTNYMGYMRYYGKFGLRNDFLLSTRTDNQGIEYSSDALWTPTGGTELEGMRSKGLMSFYKGSLGISGGVEYNISGSTVLVAELGYFYGFTEVFQQEGSLFGDDEKDMSLYRKNETNGREYYSPSLKQSQLILKLAVLF